MGKITIDLNCDLGENYGAYQLHTAEHVMEYITSANIACGYHAGDPVEMNKTVQRAISSHVCCGAHPGYPDLLGFGRRDMIVEEEELKCYLIYQIGALNTICRANNASLTHVKPHGSLYLNAVEDPKIAQATAEAISAIDKNIIYFVLAGSKGETMADYGRSSGLKVALEGFPGRAYTPEGTLVPRSQVGAVLTDPDNIIERALSMVLENTVQTVDGTSISLHVNTISIPSEIPDALEVIKKMRNELTTQGVDIVPIDKQRLP